VAALAHVFGMRPAPPSRCRVLELGCGLGGNVVPMADTLPESEIVGIDGSAQQIAVGQADVTALGLTNITLRAMDIRDVDASLGTFDYIICHGVYSWVPDEVRAKILRVCAEQLAPHGVAFISFNAYPGWHLRGMIRDVLRREVGDHGSPEERVERARALLRLLGAASAEGNPARAWLLNELELLDRLSDKYLFYEYLVPENQPVYFADFAAAANRVGLQYLGDAHVQAMAADRCGPEVAAEVERRAESLVETEQYLDLVEVRYFRCALLCREEVQIERELSPERLLGLHVSSWLLPRSSEPALDDGVSETFGGVYGVEASTTRPILKAALLELAEASPGGIVFEKLCDRARGRLDGVPATLDERRMLGEDMLRLYVNGQIELGMGARAQATRAGPLPRTSGLVRLRASRGADHVTCMHHHGVSIDGLDRSLLERMDGTHTVDELVSFVLADLEAETFTMEADGEPIRDRETLRGLVDEKLARLARRGLIIG
jgi:methyltransferase-like protein/protein-L-isoaspartate O-methyltransferase